MIWGWLQRMWTTERNAASFNNLLKERGAAWFTIRLWSSPDARTSATGGLVSGLGQKRAGFDGHHRQNHQAVIYDLAGRVHRGTRKRDGNG